MVSLYLNSWFVAIFMTDSDIISTFDIPLLKYVSARSGDLNHG